MELFIELSEPESDDDLPFFIEIGDKNPAEIIEISDDDQSKSIYL
jgi:hypothetical protein